MTAAAVGFERIEAGWWLDIAQQLVDAALEWCQSAALMDLRFWEGQVRLGRVRRLPSRRQLAARWGWTGHRVRTLLRGEGWHDPHHAAPDRSHLRVAQNPPTSRPVASRPLLAQTPPTRRHMRGIHTTQNTLHTTPGRPGLHRLRVRRTARPEDRPRQRRPSRHRWRLSPARVGGCSGMTWFGTSRRLGTPPCSSSPTQAGTPWRQTWAAAPAASALTASRRA
jgi:hypothetical protein